MDVSICIITYNHVEFISDAIESVLNQKHELKVEVLIGDDGSTDGTTEICKSFVKSNPTQMKLISGKEEERIYIKGKPTGRANLLRCLKQAKGKYIALLDGDDYWTDVTKIQKQFNCLENSPKVALSFHDATLKGINGDLLESSWLNHVTKEIPQNILLSGFPTPINTMFFRNKIDFHDKPITVVPCGDLFLTHLIAHGGSAINQSDQIQNSIYRVTGKGVWTKQSVLQKIINEIESRYWILRTLPPSFSSSYYHWVRRTLKPLKELRKIKFNLYCIWKLRMLLILIKKRGFRSGMILLNS